MIRTLQDVIERAFAQLSHTTTAYLPPLLAGLIILFGAYVTAVLVRLLLTRLIKGAGIDRFLQQSGVSYMFDRSGRVRTSRLIAGSTYWVILGIGFLTAVSAFNTELTNRMVEGIVLLFPKLVTAGLILLAGAWLAQYLGRSTLVWAVNEGLPSPRKIAMAIRTVIMFVAVVVAADHLDFARSVFLAAFVILVGGAVLAASIALGLGAKGAVQRHFQDRAEHAEETPERSLWNHL